MPLKHVIAINGSPRKKKTLALLEKITTHLETYQVQTTVLNLGDYQIGDCTGCEACILRTSRCVQEDDVQEIKSRIVAADGIILASPVFMMQITGKMKSLIDRTAHWFHRPPNVGKPALAVATTQGAGLGDTLDYLQTVSIQWGMHPTGKIGWRATDKSSRLERHAERFAWHLSVDRQFYRPSLKQIMTYQVQKVLALKVFDIDRAYWEERGWDQRFYYYPCRISLYKRLIGWAFYQVLYRRTNPVNSS
jgi:multimeric flavodoxin WrbA